MTPNKVKAARPQDIDPEVELAAIRKKLQHPTREDIKYWLDLGNPYLNRVMGSEAMGMPYGKQFEMSGWESHGKTAILYEIAGLAQKDGAQVGIWDLEDSTDDEWMTKRGVDTAKVMKFKPLVGLFKGENKKRPITAEEQAEEIELWMDRCYERSPSGRIFLGVDSIAGMMTKEEEAKGISEQNMRTKVSVPQFLGYLQKRWQKRCSNYNAIILWINQLRIAPGAWGNPEYTPGGNSMRFWATVRVKVRRIMSEKGRIRKQGKVIGFKGTIQNYKNKAGEDSHEGAVIGFKLLQDGRSKYVSANEVKPDKFAEE
jgi:recombination protein RecA